MNKNNGRRFLKLSGVLSVVLFLTVSIGTTGLNAQNPFSNKTNRGPFYRPSSSLVCSSTIIPQSQSGFVKKFTGSIIKYTYTITNTGDAADIFSLSSSQVGDPMTPRFLNMSNNPITATPSLSPGQSFSFQLELRVGSGSPDVYNTTYVYATSQNCNTITSTGTAISYEYAGKAPNPTSADLEISKSASPPNPAVTDIITYTLLIYNNGTVPASNVIITDNFPSTVIYVPNSASSGATISGNNISWTESSIAPLATVIKTFKVSLSCTSGSSITNFATVASSPPDADLSNNNTSLTTSITGTGTPASITNQPSNSTACSGGNTSFSVTAAGTGLTYQWQVNTGSGFTNVTNGGANPTYSGATTSTLFISNAPSSMSGYIYRIIVSGTCGASVTSNSATLSFYSSLNAGGINGSNIQVCTGYAVSTALNLNSPAPSGGSTPYTYQWQLNGSSISGATSSTYTPPTFTIAGTYSYTCIVTDACGTSATTSTPKVITVYPDPSVTISGGGSFCLNSTTTISATVTDGTGIMQYQWQSGPSSTGPWTNIGGLTTSSTYSPPTSSPGTTYYQVVLNPNVVSCNNATSNVISVTVNPLPTITLGTAASVCFNTSAQTTTLIYSATTNAPTTFSITWDATALGAGFINITDAALPASPITIPVPANAAAGAYTGTITVKNLNGCVSAGTSFTITIKPKPGPVIITHN